MTFMGRAKEFEREHALERAMYVFWSKGYEGASIPDLIQHMGISRSSLYETYGDKQALFLETLSYYKMKGEKKRDLLRNASSAKKGLRDYFEWHINDAINESLPGGCMITNTAISLDHCHEQVRDLVQERFDSLAEEFYRLIERGKQSGEISSHKDARKLANLLLGLNHGIGVMARVTKDAQVLENMMEEAIELL
ncbi:HTH-type transcriptional repressor ComR [compost metagenome]